MTHRDEIRKRKLGCLMVERIEPSRDWITTRQAARMLSISVSSFQSLEFKCGIRHRSRNARNVTDAYGLGWLWYRPDVEAAARIRSECRLGASAAVRVLLSMREARLPPIQH